MLHAVSIRRSAPRLIVELRGDPAAAARVAARCGLALPVRPNREAKTGAIAVAWIGPRRWLIQAPAETETTLLAALDAACAAEPMLDAAVATDMFAIFEIDGAGAVDLLAQGCALDLDGDALPADGVTGTEMWQVAVILRRVAPGFEILVDRSLAGFLENWLVTAARGQQDLDAAIRAYLGAEAADPSLAEVQKKLGLCYQQQGKDREAAARYQRYLATNPPDAAKVKAILGTLQ